MSQDAVLFVNDSTNGAKGGEVQNSELSRQMWDDLATNGAPSAQQRDNQADSSSSKDNHLPEVTIVDEGSSASGKVRSVSEGGSSDAFMLPERMEREYKNQSK